MNSINNETNNILSNLSIGNKTKDEPKSNELGQSEFLKLMITQMNNQNPLDPQDNTEFIAQLAQFSSVEGLERLNSNFEDFSGSFMSNQALQASSLVGSSVTVPSEISTLMPEGIVSGSVELGSSTQNLRVRIFNQQNQQVAQIPLGAQSAGEVSFRWDGQNMEVNGELVDWTPPNGEPLPPGIYRFEAFATQGGENQQLDTALSANVNSVTLNDNGELTLNLANIGPVGIDEVRQFN